MRMAFFDRLNDFAKNLGDKTNDAIEIGKLNNRINSERNAAKEDLRKIGEYYYGLYTEGIEVAPEVMEFCMNAQAHYEAAAAAQAEIDRMKEENEAQKAAAAQAAAEAQAQAAAQTAQTQSAAGNVCPSCGTVNQPGIKFCQECGTKLETPPPAPAGIVCPSCGTENAPGTKFCQECGSKLEIPAPEPEAAAEPVPRLCPECGAEVADGMKFCSQCGHRME